MHIKNIYADGELEEDSTCKEFLQVQTGGAGHVSADQTKRYAFQQYEIYDEHRLQMQEEQVVDELMQSAKDIKKGKK